MLFSASLRHNKLYLNTKNTSRKILAKLKFLSLKYLLILRIEVEYIQLLRLTVCLFIAVQIFHKGMRRIKVQFSLLALNCGISVVCYELVVGM